VHIDGCRLLVGVATLFEFKSLHYYIYLKISVK
jgi:hypothetical protein